MPWWGWMITGSVLLGAEMFGISAEFYLVFLGAAAIAVGLLGALGVAWPDWAQWLTFAALAIVCMVTFRERLYRRFRANEEEVEARLPSNASLHIPVRLEAGATCRVEYRGTTWTARNVGSQAIEADSAAEIAEVNGLTLHIRKPAAA